MGDAVKHTPDNDVRRHTGRRCVHCAHWQKRDPDDWTAPEGHCSLTNDPGFYPFGYWPYTLASDVCGSFAEVQHG